MRSLTYSRLSIWRWEWNDTFFVLQDCFIFMSLVRSLWVSAEMMSKLSPLHDKSTKCERRMNQIWTVMTVHNGAVVQTLCVFLSRFWEARQLHLWDYVTFCGIVGLWLIWRLNLVWFYKQCFRSILELKSDMEWDINCLYHSFSMQKAQSSDISLGCNGIF